MSQGVNHRKYMFLMYFHKSKPVRPERSSRSERSRRTDALWIFLFLAFDNTLHAQDYPTKPARIVVGYPPGGANDLIARIAAQKLSELWSQQFIVENRPGASAVIGTEVVARAAPDGYTLGLVIIKSTFSGFANSNPKDFLQDTKSSTNVLSLFN